MIDGAAPIRILHVLPDLTSGGMERATVRLATGLQRVGPFEQAIALMGGADAELSRQLPPAVSVYERLGGRWGLYRAIRSYRPHLVHARSTGMWLDSALAVRGGALGCCSVITAARGWNGRDSGGGWPLGPHSRWPTACWRCPARPPMV